MTRDGGRTGILAVDTATSQVVIAIGTPEGRSAGVASWTAGFRHGETLLPAIGRFLDEQGLPRASLAGIVVGTGPGQFTGLRVGLATAKGLAHGLGIPLVGVSTAEALLAAAMDDDPRRPVLLLPAGPRDRLVARGGSPPEALPHGTEPAIAEDERLVAVDLDERAPDEALAAGERARAGLGAALIRLGAGRLAALPADRAAAELATLVPEYVTLPRGVRASTGSVEWSRDPR